MSGKAPIFSSGFLPLIESGADEARVATLHTSHKIQTVRFCTLETQDIFYLYYNAAMGNFHTVVAESR